MCEYCKLFQKLCNTYQTEGLYFCFVIINRHTKTLTMKKIILAIAVSFILIVVFLISRNTTAEKIEKAENEIVEANNDLDQANQEYIADMEKYKQEAAAKIAANDKSISDFNARKEYKKDKATAEYANKIAELEQKNSDMGKQMDDYKAQGKDKWEKFKEQFNIELDKMGKALKDIAK